MRALAAGVMMLSAGMAQAGAGCTFGSECYEEEGCAFTQFALAIEGSGAEARLVSDAGTVPGALEATEGGGSLFRGMDDSGAWQMVIAPEGLARLAVMYFEGPMMITYFGQCEAAS